MEEKIFFWQTRVKITQAPNPFEPSLFSENNSLPFEDSKEVRSFLYDPIGEIPFATYGLEIKYKKNLEVIFFTIAKSEKQAKELGYAWLSYLKYKFIGLDGEVYAKPISQKIVEEWNMSKKVEIKIPFPAIKNRINIIERFITSFYYNEEISIQLFILWQRYPLEEDKINPQVYHLKIFIKYDLKDSNPEQILKFKGNLKFLFSDIENTEGVRASIVDASNLTLLDFFNGNLFKSDILNVVSNFSVNFDFPEILPLPRIPILENENVRYIDITPEFTSHAISLGNHVKKGVMTKHITYIPINKLPQDMVIFGKSGTGKTYFLAKFIKELCQKVKNVGILVLNVAKESQEIYYKDFQTIKYSDDDFHIPYFIDGDNTTLNKRLQETATIFVRL